MTTILDHPTWDKTLNPPDRANMPRRISNSETSAYLQCERKWYYNYALNLEPVTTGKALSRGIIGHEVLAAYYSHLLNAPGDYENAKKAAWSCFAQFATDSQADVVMLGELRQLISRYFDFSRGDGWKILAVEQTYDIDVNDQFNYVMRLDLLAEIDGKVVLVDHKFVYEHYDQNTLDMNVQMPKYIGALSANGIQVDYAMLNQIKHRTRKTNPYTDEETFQRVVVRPSAVEIRTVMREQFKASTQIAGLLKMDDQIESLVIRTMNQMTCKNCSFLKLCKADLIGQSTSKLMSTDYRANSYNNGYNPTPIEEEV